MDADLPPEPSQTAQGLKIYYTPNHATIDIIAVPGFAVEPEKSWTWCEAARASDEDGINFNWLSDRNGLQKDFPQARIMLYQYNSQYRGPNNVDSPLDNIASEFLTSLQARRETCQERPMIFIAHSMGGLLVAQTLVRIGHRRDQYPKMYECFAAAMFFGTPFRGADVASIAAIYASTTTLYGEPWYTSLLHFMEPSSTGLKQLRRDARQLETLLIPKLNFYCVYEKQKTDFGKFARVEWLSSIVRRVAHMLVPECLQIFVSEDSSILDGVENYGLHRSHCDLVRFRSVEDHGYCDVVKPTLEKFVKVAVIQVQARLNCARGISQSFELQRRQITDWMNPPNSFSNYEKARDQWQKGTGQWLLNGDAFSRWKSTPSSFLWLYGIPGCGKTVLSSAILTHLEQQSQGWNSILYFYFDFADARKQKLDDAMRCLITQICSQREEACTRAHAQWKSCYDGYRQPSTGQLSALFQDLIQQVGETWIILDALDECSTRANRNELGVLPWMKSLVKTNSNVHLLVTSRAEHDIESSVKSWTQDQDQISISAEAVTPDIDRYIRTRVREQDGLKRWRGKEDVLLDIEATLSSKANGMFRWVSCQLDVLEGCREKRSLRNKLASLPKDLNETYERILHSIPEEDIETAIRLLQLLIYSDRPLFLEEAVDAIAVEIGTEPGFDPENRLPDPAEIVCYCSSLVTIATITYGDDNVPPDKELRLAHFSVREYFLSLPMDSDWSSHFKEEIARAAIAQVCLTYLLYPDPGLDSDDFQSLYPMARYCAEYWGLHLRLAQAGNHTKEAESLAVWLLTKKDFCMGWLRLFNPDYPISSSEGEHTHQNTPPHYFAAILGLHGITATLIDRGGAVNAPGGAYGNALKAAAARGHKEVVKLLVDMGADINARSGESSNALQAAAYEGDKEVVELLLDMDADVNAQGGFYGNALQAAAKGGHKEIVKSLLEMGADVNALGGVHGNALQAAAAGGHKEIVKLLLDKDADVNGPGGFHGNALRAAAARGHKEIVRLLLDMGADVNAQSSDYNSAPSDRYGSALQAAAYTGNIEVVRLLLDRKAEVNAQGGWYGNALQAAAYKGHIQVVKMLVDTGAEVNAQNGTYGNALQAAAYKGNLEVVKSLIDLEADVNAQGGLYGTCLLAAACRGSVETIQFLLAKGSDPNTQDALGRSILHFGSLNRNRDVLQFLLRNFDGVNTDDSWHWTPLHWAAHGRNFAAVVTLIKVGGDPYRQDLGGRDPYRIALMTADHQIIETIGDARSGNKSCQEGNLKLGSQLEGICHHCAQPLFEEQNHCTICAHYDLCYRCFQSVDKIHEGHRFQHDFRY